MESRSWPTDEVIGPFEGEYRFLSNFSPVSVRYDGTDFVTAEHAYQAAKARDDPDVYDRIAASSDPDEAKRLGRRTSLPPDWKASKKHVMLEVVTAKFAQNPSYRDRLLATGEATLVELNSWGDTYWGADVETGAGVNALGRILMGVRSTLRFEPRP